MISAEHINPGTDGVRLQEDDPTGAGRPRGAKDGAEPNSLRPDGGQDAEASAGISLHGIAAGRIIFIIIRP